MFEKLFSAPDDKIITLMHTFSADPRVDKIDLGVGVYKNANGSTPIMHSVKKAENQLWEIQSTKNYVGLAGDFEFHDVMRELILKNCIGEHCVAAAATPGGTGAIRQALELIKNTDPNATVWISSPTWPNHPSIIAYLGIKQKEYRYFDYKTGCVEFENMLEDLSYAKPGDVVLLHGCCHNPTGANLKMDQWSRLTEILLDGGLIPFIDIAYQGFGDGLDEDAAGVRYLATNIPEVIIASSCSKNFGIYRERTGILMLVSHNKRDKIKNQKMLTYLNRQNYSFPPDHGARLVTMILRDSKLRKSWEGELKDIQLGMLQNRESLALELRKQIGSDRFGFLAEHRGMFSLLGATEMQVDEMRDRYGIYMISDSRMNIAALNAKAIHKLTEAIIAVKV